MIVPEPQSTQRFGQGLLVEIYQDRGSAGSAAAGFVIPLMADLIAQRGQANVVFAAAPSQDEMLEALSMSDRIDWTRVHALHMDEYLGIDPDHSASFRCYLRQHLFERVPIPDDQVHLISGERTDDPEAVCRAYAALLEQYPPDIVCGGIGENGHLAFNDPPVADFHDPKPIKVVELDHECRTQQVNDGCFARLEDVPTHAFTLTIPTLMAASKLAITVPGPRKAEAVAATLHGPIDVSCPASILRRHPEARLFLDRDSARSSFDLGA